MEMTIEKIGINWVPKKPAPAGYFVLLKEKNGEHYLCIFIGQSEAESILAGMEKIERRRPLTHDLLSRLLKDTCGKLKHVGVSDLKDSTFYGILAVENDGKLAEIDTRPSDALAIAARHGCPILVADKVIERAGITPEQIEKGPKSFSTLWPFSQ